MNDIYKKNESYERIMEKVWTKVKNIMKLRQRVCQAIYAKSTLPGGAPVTRQAVSP